MAPTGEPEASEPGGERVPLGSWPRLYGAVIVCAVLVMALAALFSAWPY